MKHVFSSLIRSFALSLSMGVLLFGSSRVFAGEQVPFKGTATGSVIAINPTATGVQLTIQASRNATQLGNFERLEELYLNPLTGQFTGTIDFTAANGDHLWVTMFGQFISPTDAVGTYAIVGGTGRFAGATGSVFFDAYSPDGLNVSVDFHGTVSSVGS